MSHYPGDVSHAHITGSWYLLGVRFKISDAHPRLFLYGSSPPGQKRPQSIAHALIIFAEHGIVNPAYIDQARSAYGTRLCLGP